MTTDDKRSEIAKTRTVTTYDFAERAALALHALVPGPNRDKKISRLLGCSVRLVQYLRRGQHWTIDRLNIASERLDGFDAYLASPDFTARLDQLARELDEIRSHIRERK